MPRGEVFEDDPQGDSRVDFDCADAACEKHRDDEEDDEADIDTRVAGPCGTG